MKNLNCKLYIRQIDNMAMSHEKPSTSEHVAFENRLESPTDDEGG